jgi:putative membrane protein
MNKELNKTDILAVERTRLANERTFLAYFRTFIVFLSSGFAIIKISLLEEIVLVGYMLLALSPLLLTIGLIRFFYVRKQLKKHYYLD